MTFGSKNVYDWFKYGTKPAYFENYLRKYGLNWESAEILGHNDEQTLAFYFIRAVPLNEIAIQDTWDENKLDKVKKWANEDTLLRIYIERFNIVSCNLPNSSPLPYLSRKLTEQNWTNPPKYEIGDGIHRIAFAKLLNLPFIMAEAIEYFTIKKEDMLILGIKPQKNEKNDSLEYIYIGEAKSLTFDELKEYEKIKIKIHCANCNRFMGWTKEKTAPELVCDNCLFLIKNETFSNSL